MIGIYNEKEGNYFLDETVLQSDYVTFLRRFTKIAWACELGLETKALRSQVIFGTPPTRIVRKGDNFITIDFHDWAAFFIKATAAFREDADMRKKVSRIVNEGLFAYENAVRSAEEQWKKTRRLSSDNIAELFKLYSHIDTFAVFNILVPMEYYGDMLAEFAMQDSRITPDDFLVSMIEPHRVLVRRNMLSLALEEKDNQCISEQSIRHFMDECMPYADFDRWLFDDDKINDPSFLQRDVAILCKNYNRQDIMDEIDKLNIRRREKISRFFTCLSRVKTLAPERLGEERTNHLVESLSFLSLVVTEEEHRHMIECRHFILLGGILKSLELDVARSTVAEIIHTAKMIWD